MNSKRFNFIAFLRGPAALFVVWDHFTNYLARHEISWVPLNLVRHYVNKPLGINWDFGFLGIAIFFFVSGFIITHAAQKEQRISFAIKRFFRIYPPLVVAILIAAVIQVIFGDITLSPRYDGDFSIKSIFLNISLLNNFGDPRRAILGVTWTLVIEEIFYFVCFLTMPWVQKRPRFALICMSAVVSSSFFLPQVVSQYTIALGFLLAGQVLYYFWKKSISGIEAALLTAGVYILLVLRYPGFISELAPSTAYAYAIFVIALILSEYIPDKGVSKLFSNISYSLYLNHFVLGSLILWLMQPIIGYSFSFICAFFTVTAASYLSWRYVEEPSRILARRLAEAVSLKIGGDV